MAGATLEVTYRGETLLLPEWSKRTGIKLHTLYHRLRVYGWDIERALTTGAKYQYHGLVHSPEYRVWNTMVMRCHNPNAVGYGRYGAKGIKVCDRWREFANFYADMGPRPFPRATLERKDGAKGYEPGNVVWATYKQQARNQASNRRVTHQGETLTLAEWCERAGLPNGTIARRMDLQGWPFEKALMTPLGPNGRKRRR
jgi:hypothetical protein